MVEHTYIISPSPNKTCLQESCSVTISEFAATYNHTVKKVNIIFLSGVHILDRELSVSHIEEFSMEAQGNEQVTTECANQFARFVVNETTFVSIKGLHFIGCASNTVTTVKELAIEDTIFQGLEIR